MLKGGDVAKEIVGAYQHLGIDINQQSWLYHLTALFVLLISVWVGYRLTRLVLQSKLTRFVLHTRNQWDDALHRHKFFRRCSHLVPAVLLYLLSGFLYDVDSQWLIALHKLAIIYTFAIGVSIGSAFLNTAEHIYNRSALAKRAPITGFIQVGKLFLTIAAALFSIAVLLDKSPALLLSGLGAITAILLLLFKDTILGFVAGIQIAANRMVNTGDWVELPKYGADGTVLEVGLTTVKVQNWDNTISTVPTYTLITDSVKNWRGMTESGGRRIKRSINIDIQSIRFCDEAMLEQFSNIRFIKDYIQSKKQELSQFHQQQQIDIHDLVNARRLTNIGTLRAYMRAYLQHHPQVNQDMTLMVRQLPPTEYGLPLELYCFSKDKSWINYEGIQADIFDHLLAILPVFGLRAYQRVSDYRHSDTVQH